MLPCMMEIFLSAVLGELASRSIDFFISKSSKPTVMVMADRLQIDCKGLFSELRSSLMRPWNGRSQTKLCSSSWTCSETPSGGGRQKI